MKPNKNIDRLFQEKLRDFEEMPPDIVWENIEAQLDGKKKRRIIPIWWRYAGVAVVLLLLTFSGIQYFKTTNTGADIDNTIVDIDNSDTPLIDNNSLPNKQTIDETIVSSPDDEDVKNNPSTINKKESPEKLNGFKQTNSNTNEIVIAENNARKSTSKSVQPQTAILKGEKSVTEASNLIAKTEVEEPSDKNQLHTTNENLSTKENLKNPLVKSTNSDVVATTDSHSNTNVNQSKKVDDKKATLEVTYEKIENLEDTLDDKYKLKEEELVVEELGKRWSVATVVAPVLYNSFNTKGSPLDLQFENSPKEGSRSVSYGVKVGFKLNNKWSLQSGVSMFNVGYTIKNVYIVPSTQFSSRLDNVDYVQTAIILNVNATNVLSQNEFETGEIQETLTGNLNQEYGYVEVPLEIKYSLTKGKLGVHLIGGFSTLFLNSNDVYVETDNFNSNLGEAKNLNDVNFSGNFGFDLDYAINKSIFINVSPMIKVYTSTFSENSDNFKPYLFGVYTGLNYRF
ncbi:MAG: hypothetical protein QM478_02160 [Flavobacteriaceae bacterium]